MSAIQQIAKQFCSTIIQPQLDKNGFNGAVQKACMVLFYSGPSIKIRNAILDKEGFTKRRFYVFNWKIAGDEAKRLNATRLDNTPIFIFLNSKTFTSLVSKLPLPTAEAADAVVKYVWDYVSDKFSRTPFKKAATLVCGATKDSSFYAKEMYGMLRNPSVEVI